MCYTEHPVSLTGTVNQGGLRYPATHITRKSPMKHLLLMLHTVFQQKFTMVLLALTTFSLIGGGSLLVQTEAAYAAAVPSGCSYYTVKSGDTLSYIGVMYHATVQDIAQVNHIPNINLIFPGQRFCIPASHVSTPTKTTPTQATLPKSTPVTGQGQGAIQPTGSVANMIYQVFGAYAPQALSIARCESGLNPGAYNPVSIGGSHAAGVFQILYPSTWMGTPQAGGSPYNAWTNILAAHAIFVRDGYNFHEWTCQ